MDTELLRRLAWHPLMRLDNERIRVRAYFLAFSRTGRSPDDPVANWLQAESEEMCELVGHRFGTACDPEHPEQSGIPFDSVYEPLVKIEYSVDVVGRPRVFRPSAPRRCSLCGGTVPDVEFKKRAHLIPELLGNREWLTSEECDTCNARFGEIHDNELGRMLLVDRAVNRVHKKGGGTAKLKQEGSESYIGGQGRGTPLEVGVKEGDDSVTWRMASDHKMVLEAWRQSYHPQRALKSVARSVWHLLPRDVQEQHDRLRQWIRGEIAPCPTRVQRVFWPGPSRDFAGLAVWRLSDMTQTLPKLVSMLHFGNVALIWSMPDLEVGQDVVGPLPSLPVSPYQPYHPSVRSMTVEGDFRVRAKKEVITFQVKGSVLTRCARPIPVLFQVLTTHGAVHEVQTSLTVATSDMGVHHVLTGDGLAGEFEFILAPTFERGKASYTLALSAYSLEVALATCELLTALEDGLAEIRIVDPSSGGLGMVCCNIRSGKNPELAECLEIIRQVQIINAEFGIGLRYPEPDHFDDLYQIQVLAAAIEYGEVRLQLPGGRVRFEFPERKHVQQFVELLVKGGRNFLIPGKAKFVIGGTVIDAGGVDHMLEAVGDDCLEGLETLAEEHWEPGEAKSALVSCESFVECYPRWLNEEDRGQEQ